LAGLATSCYNTDKERKTLIDSSKENSLEVNAEKTKYMLLSFYQDAGQNHNINIANKSFENVVQFKYLGTTVKNKKLIQEETENRLNLGNACYHSVQNLSSSCLLSKNVKIRIYKITLLPVVLHGCETWSLTLREEHRVKISESKLLRRIFGPKRDEVTGGWRKLHNEELHNFVLFTKYN
jgi:hypothetical protein